MGERRGCWKNGCLGCLGLIVVGAVFTGVMALIAWNDRDEADLKDEQLAPTATAGAPPAAGAPVWLDHPGRLVLDLSQGEFTLRPARPGEGLSARARFDAEVHTIEERFEVMPDSTWVYGISFYRHMPPLQALFRGIFGGDNRAEVQVFIPSEVPVTLEIMVKEGGFEADLGGLWLPAADIRYDRGGFSLAFDEPLREPMRSLHIRGKMGGFQAVKVGNASPADLVVDCRMGGADLDLEGLWLQDCDARLSVRMGGMDVGVPADVIVEGAAVDGLGLRRPAEEGPVPVLRLTTSQRMGEIEVRKR